jgi:hypothetical protein
MVPELGAATGSISAGVGGTVLRIRNPPYRKFCKYINYSCITYRTCGNYSCMGRPRRFENRKQVTFSVSEAEYKWIELQASGNISQWCHEQVLADYDGAEPRRADVSHQREANSGRVEVPISAEMPTAPNPSKKQGSVCKHGTAKGYNCWQCGSVAKVGE